MTLLNKRIKIIHNIVARLEPEEWMVIKPLLEEITIQKDKGELKEIPRLSDK
jgi:hypothetical protein